MNTPAHLLVNLALLGGRGAPEEVRPQSVAIAVGAVLCDAPMFAFYLWQSGVQGQTEASIWSDLYFRPEWQDFFDVFNSVPLMLAGLGVATVLRQRIALLLFASMLLHAALDLPFHVDDAHRHFYPLSEWRFESALSYWDPRFHGGFVAFGEMILVWASSFVLWGRTRNRVVRASVLGLCALYVVGWTAFYAMR